MQFRDLNAQYRRLQPEIDEAVKEVLASGKFIMGPQVSQLEEVLARYVGVKHVITCGNGTDALTLALKAWEIGPGDAVFVADFTFFASAEVISLEGATPCFVDVDERTFNLSPEALRNAIDRVLQEGRLTPRAIIAVDLFGLPADYPALQAIAEEYHLMLLEDGAQGFGGSIRSHRSCSFGDIATTSFFPAKPLGCYGDGGALFTDNDEWADRIRSLRIHGKGSDKYDNVRIGLNSRLDTLQAAILLVKLRAFEAYELQEVNRVASHYTRRLEGAFTTPYIPEGYGSSWAQYTLQLPDHATRDALQQRLKAAGIPTMIYYPRPMHRQSVFAGLQPDSCPTASRLSDCVLSLPMHPYLSPEEIDHICDLILG